MIEGCLIYGNTIGDVPGGAIAVSVSAVVTLINNTIENNEAQGGAGGVAELKTGSCVGKNNIIYANKGKQWEGNVKLTYSCSSQQLSGTGNITSDPMYVSAGNNDYHLKNISVYRVRNMSKNRFY